MGQNGEFRCSSNTKPMLWMKCIYFSLEEGGTYINHSALRA